MTEMHAPGEVAVDDPSWANDYERADDFTEWVQGVLELDQTDAGPSA